MTSTLDFLEFCPKKVEQLRRNSMHESADTMQRLLNIVESYQIQLKNKDRKLQEYAERVAALTKENAELRATGVYYGA